MIIVRLEVLRHTHATMLMNSGVNLKEIQKRLGHANIRITLYMRTIMKILNEMQLMCMKGI
ncbi:tyrosine-type recombinase/integrase [Metaclostridioides mangenotii]|uniref:tyrosine-type recombinase/integrase n=1 Tax=Metaclostridioides mangenotii TaxID=1540 RepID=UPI002E8E527A|nr:tyrosine-type recombinase/integrase [Clostridioides mangenotii]